MRFILFKYKMEYLLKKYQNKYIFYIIFLKKYK